MSIESPCPLVEQRHDRIAPIAAMAARAVNRNTLLDLSRTIYNSSAGDGEGSGSVESGGTPGRGLRPAVVGAALVLLLGACSGSDADTSVLPSSSSQTSTSSATIATTPSAGRPTTTEGPPVSEDALAAWVKLMEVAGQDASDPMVGDLATPDVAGQLRGIFPAEQQRQVVSFASAEAVGDGIAIQDCLILDSPLSTSNAVWFSGHATPDGSNGWVIDHVTVESLVGCVPSELAGPVIKGYLDHFAARNEFLRDPDPGSPRLSGTTTGRQFDLYVELTADWANEGLSYRDSPEMHPEIVQVVSMTHLVILDCQLADPDAGIYVVSTGERTDLIRPIADGERDALQTDMVLVDEVWKVENVGAERNIPCEIAPTSVGLPMVPVDKELGGS